MKTITGQLLDNLLKTNDINKYLSEHEADFIAETPASLIEGVLVRKNISVSEAARLSGVGNYVYKILSGERKASRNVVIAVAVGCGFSYEETQLLLRVSKFAILDSRDKRDSVVIFAINNAMSVYSLDDLLYENGLDTINQNK